MRGGAEERGTEETARGARERCSGGGRELVMTQGGMAAVAGGAWEEETGVRGGVSALCTDDAV